MAFIFSQISIVIAYIFIGATYALKRKNMIVLFNYLYLLFSSVSFLLLSSYIGIAMNFVAVIRNILLDIRNRNNAQNNVFIDYLIIIFITAISVILSLLTYDSFYSLFSMFSTVLYSYSLWQKSIPLYKILGIPASILFIVYNVFIPSPFGIICESTLLIFIIIENIKFFTKKKLNN